MKEDIISRRNSDDVSFLAGRFVDTSNKSLIFGVSYIQRMCGVSHSYALGCNVRDELLRKDIIEPSNNDGSYRFTEINE